MQGLATPWLLSQPLLLLTLVGIAVSFPYYDENDELEAVKRMLAHPQAGSEELSKAALDEYFYRMQGIKEQGLGGYKGRGDNGVVTLDLDWPEDYVTSKVGQVGGLAVCPEGNAHVFHRASRVWEEDMFDKNNVYTKKAEGPIKEMTVLQMAKLDGKTLHKASYQWSANRFYLPHGLTLDHQKNYWLTDVATHQVYKFPPGAKEPSLVLGTAFEPAQDNRDKNKFCKPTAVAVAENGQFFVADGYCNSRVVKFSANGTVIGIIEENFEIPHSLALVEDQDLICVADRENERIVCFRAGLEDNKLLGVPVDEFADFNLGRVFAIAYSPNDKVMFAVTQASYGMQMPMCYTINMDEDRNIPDLMAQWTPDDAEFDQPHAIAVSPDGSTVYVGLIDHESSRKVWKFDRPAQEQPEHEEGLEEEEEEQEQGEDEN